MGNSYCKICNESDINKLVVDKSKKRGVRNKCKECQRKCQRGGPSKNNHLKRTYGITLKDFNIMLLVQNSRCKVCDVHRDSLGMDLHVDHCHKTNKVRALLCSSCNQGLGNFKDNPDILIKATEYLKKYG